MKRLAKVIWALVAAVLLGPLAVLAAFEVANLVPAEVITCLLGFSVGAMVAEYYAPERTLWGTVIIPRS